jgi:deoxycytidine triphosphate deaminase
MILSDRGIIANIESGNIVCTPLDLANISNSSIDLRLGQYIAKQPRRFSSSDYHLQCCESTTVNISTHTTWN